MAGEIPGAPGSSTEGRSSVDDSDSVDDGGSGRGSDDRVLTPDSPDEPTNTTGSGGDRSSSDDDDHGGWYEEDDSSSSSSGSGTDDRVLTPESPTEPTNTAGSGGDRGSTSGGTSTPSSNPLGGGSGSGSRPSSDPFAGVPDSSISRTRDDGFGLEDAADSNRTRRTREAERLEQRVLSQNPRYGEDDVRVVERDGELVVVTSPWFERQRAKNRREAADNIPGTGVGKTEFAQDRQRENDRAAARRESVENIPGTGVGENPFAQDRDDQSDRAAARRNSLVNIPGVESPRTTRKRKLQNAKASLAAQASEELGQDYNAGDVTVTQNEDGTLSLSLDQKETFDTDWSFGLGDPEKDEVENVVDGAADTYSRETGKLIDGLFDEKGATSNALGDDILRAVGQDELAESYDREVRNFGRGLFTGAASLGNVPGLVGTGMEAAEVGAAGASAATTAGDQEFFSKTFQRGGALAGQVYDEATENPANSIGLAAGALAGSYGAISAASRVSSRAGLATRYAIQPGEELLGSAGYRATKATAGTRAADRLFPNKEPLIFSEEAAIRGGKKAVSKVRGLEYQDAATRFQPSGLAKEAKSAQFKASELLRSDAPTRVNTDLNTPVLDAAKREARSARFKAEELLRSDGPTRVNTDVNSKYLDAARREARSARFKAEELLSSDVPTRVNTGVDLPRLETARQEAKSAQFKVEELLRSDASVRMNSDINTRYLDAAQREAKSARFKAAEARDDAGRRLQNFRGELREFAADNRGQADVPRSRLRDFGLGSDLDIGRASRPELDSGSGTGFTRRRETTLTGPSSSSTPFTSGLRDLGPELATGGSQARQQLSELTSPLEFAGGETELGRSEIFGETELESSSPMFESRSRTELDFGPRELEFESELELETETELELEGDGLTGGLGRRRRSPFGKSPFSKTLERDLINPFTGE